MSEAPSARDREAFAILVRSLRVGGEGGEIGGNFVRLHLVGQNNTRVEYPESTNERAYEVARTIYSTDHGHRYFQFAEIVDDVLEAASDAALVRASESSDVALDALFTRVFRVPSPIRMLLEVAPRMFFPEDSVQVGDVTLFRASESALRERWPRLYDYDPEWQKHLFGQLKDHLVAELTIVASPRRAQELAGEQLTATLGLLGLAYIQVFDDWPTAGLLPSLGARSIAEHADGSLHFGPVTFFNWGLMQFPVGFLPGFLEGSAGHRFAEAISGRRADDVSRRLLVALQWWASGSEPGPWAMRFSRYMTVFETLFGRSAERGKPGLTKRLAKRVAVFAARDRTGIARARERFTRLYDVRSDTIHEGALTVDPGFAYDAMRLGAIALVYVARSRLTTDADFHRHTDAMIARNETWMNYGFHEGLDPGM